MKIFKLLITLNLVISIHIIHAQTSFNVSNKTTGDTLFTIDENGKVGIGTTAPVAKLEVLSTDPDNNSSLRLATSDLSVYLRLYSGRASFPNPFIMWNAGSALRFGTSFGSEFARLTSEGNLGIGTTTPTEMLEVADTIYSTIGGFKFPDGSVQSTSAFGGDNGFVSTGTFGTGSIPIEGAGTRMMWYPGKAAFRVGYVPVGSPTNWDDANIGSYSFAAGNGPIANGIYSVAMGHAVVASGDHSTAFGQYSEASDSYATAMGYSTEASAWASTALGENTRATGRGSTVMGRDSWARGDFSMAVGDHAEAYNNNAIAMGSNVINYGPSSIAIGSNSEVTASAIGSIALGVDAYTESPSSTSLGRFSRTTGEGATAIGYSAEAHGNYSIAIGLGADVIGQNSMAISMISGTPTVVQDCTIALLGGKVGIGEVAPTAKLQVNGQEGVVFTGTFGSGTIPIEGEGNRFLWCPSKAAFRAGYVNASQWDESNIGDYSQSMGLNTIASGIASIALGRDTEASATSATSMGYLTTASGLYSTAMGRSTTASGTYSTAMGRSTIAGGEYSTALGSFVETTGSGSFVIGDNSTTTIPTFTSNNRFYARFANGYRIYTSSGLGTGVEMLAGASSWSSVSDSTKKENFKSMDGEEVLNKISEFRLGSWNYIGQDPTKFRHYGPMAQDFYAAFGNDGIGTIGNDTTIASADFDGINFIAIQALEKRTSDLQKENTQLKEEISTLKSKIEKLESLFSKIEKLQSQNKEQLAHNK